MKSEDSYRQVADEIENGRQDRALWTWAQAESGGDADKTKALYIRRRVAALVAAANTASIPVVSELQGLRAELRRELAFQRKNSLYSVLGMPADSSDGELAAAIGRLMGGDQPLDAETRYAVETLGDANAREQFDRRLVEQLRQRPIVSASKDQAGEPEFATQMGSGRKALIAAILVLGLGYLGQGYMKDKSERELRLKEAEIRSEEIRRKAEISNRVVDNQTTALEASIGAQERSAATREQYQLEARMRDDKARLDYAYRQEQQAAQAEQRRLQTEQSRLQADARRREYEAANQTRAIRQQMIQDAIARGNYNEAQRLRNQQY
jgi:hypothetical protein